MYKYANFKKLGINTTTFHLQNYLPSIGLAVIKKQDGACCEENTV